MECRAPSRPQRRASLTRVRTWIAALLVCATVGLTAVDAQAAQPDPPRTYEVTADLDGRLSPTNRPGAIVAVDFLHERQQFARRTAPRALRGAVCVAGTLFR